MQDAWEAAEAEVAQSGEATQPACEVSGIDFLGSYGLGFKIGHLRVIELETKMQEMKIWLKRTKVFWKCWDMDKL